MKSRVRVRGWVKGRRRGWENGEKASWVERVVRDSLRRRLFWDRETGEGLRVGERRVFFFFFFDGIR